MIGLPQGANYDTMKQSRCTELNFPWDEEVQDGSIKELIDALILMVSLGFKFSSDFCHRLLILMYYITSLDLHCDGIRE